LEGWGTERIGIGRGMDRGNREEWVRERVDGSSWMRRSEGYRGRDREKGRYDPLDNSPLLAGLLCKCHKKY